MTDTAPDVNGLINLLNALAIDFECDDKHDAKETCDKAAAALRTLLERNAALERERDQLRAERDALVAENERLKEDRARFPDRPDDIGRMIEAHIGNLKAGKESAEALADKAFDRAFQAEAKLAEAMKVIGQIDTALNDQFAAGIEEREGGSARRQERLMKSGEELRRAARKLLKENGNDE